MALYQMTDLKFEPIVRKTFSELEIRERDNLQKLLKEAIHIVSPDTLVLAEEFSYWQDSKRRIDLLGLDSNGSLVVIEIKRTEDGSHMELQAVRYAAMVSAITFDHMVEIYSDTLKSQGKEEDSLKALLEHLNCLSRDEVKIDGSVRIVLVSANFSKEITTTVLWLNDQGLDIRCVRLISYHHKGNILVDVQQVLPLPEAADYTIQMREKRQEERAKSSERAGKNNDKFNLILGSETVNGLPKNRAIWTVVFYLVSKEISPEKIGELLPLNSFYQIEGLVKTEDQFCEAATLTSLKDDKKPFDQTKWFTRETELMHHRGNTYALSNGKWGPLTERHIQNLSEKFRAHNIRYERIAQEYSGIPNLSTPGEIE